MVLREAVKVRDWEALAKIFFLSQYTSDGLCAKHLKSHD